MRKEVEKEKMISYMERKYGEKFDFVESYAGQAGKSYAMIILRSRVRKERQTLVRLSDRNGQCYYEDNYAAYLLKDEIEKIETELACQCLGKCRLCYKIPDFVFPFRFQKDMTPDEFLKDIHSMPKFFIYPENSGLNRQEWEERVQGFCKLNAGRGYKIRGTLRINSDELIFSMDEKDKFRYMRWL